MVPSISDKIQAVHRYLLHNGKIREARETVLSPGQVGFMNGWGVFSTLRVSDGVLFAYERHYARMAKDARLLRVPFEISQGELQKALLSLVEMNSALNATLRVAVVRNKGGLFEAPDLDRDCDIIAFTAELSNWGAGAHLCYVPNGRFAACSFSGTKITSWSQNLTWSEEAHERGFDEVVLLNERGQVSECTSANIFAMRDKQVVTPPVQSSGCLPGVTRAILLEDIQIPGLSVTEGELTPSELESSEQVFVTSTTRDLLPVLSVDHRELKQDPATLTLLQQAFAEYRAGYVAAHSAKAEVLAV
jgi:branched-chain amino acid aminotransferase